MERIRPREVDRGFQWRNIGLMLIYRKERLHRDIHTNVHKYIFIEIQTYISIYTSTLNVNISIR